MAERFRLRIYFKLPRFLVLGEKLAFICTKCKIDIQNDAIVEKRYIFPKPSCLLSTPWKINIELKLPKVGETLESVG